MSGVIITGNATVSPGAKVPYRNALRFFIVYRCEVVDAAHMQRKKRLYHHRVKTQTVKHTA